MCQNIVKIKPIVYLCIHILVHGPQISEYCISCYDSRLYEANHIAQLVQ